MNTRIFSIVFAKSPTDAKLLEASIKALNSDVLAARYGHAVEYDDSTEKTTLKWWRLGGGPDAQ